MESEVLSHGETSALSEEALDRFAKLVKRIKDWKEIRLVFVSPRPSCEQDTYCNGEQLAWLRVQQVVDKIKDRIKDEGGSRTRVPVSMAFSDEIETQDLPSPAESLTLLLEHTASVEKPPCGATISLQDHSLPLQLASGRPAYSFVLNNRETVHAGGNTRLLFGNGASKSLIVWEDERGRFRKQDLSEENQPRLLPYGAVRLYVVAVPSGDSVVSRFGSSLGSGFAALPRPSFLPPANGGSRLASVAPADRGFNDNPRRVGAGTIRPSSEDTAEVSNALSSNQEVAVCDFEFVWH